MNWLTQDKHDEDLYDYYAKSRLVVVSVTSGEVRFVYYKQI
jgi:hypothetical protein